MAEKTEPLSEEQAPDPSDNYERSHPEHEAGMGRLDNDGNATLHESPDRMNDAVDNIQDGAKQINAHEDGDPVKSAPKNPDDSVAGEEPLGWDQKPSR